MKTSRQVIEEQLKLHPYIKPKGTEAVSTFVMPGRRVEGEDWVKVTIGHDGSEIVMDTEDAERPVGARPVVAFSGADTAYTEHILAAAAEKAQGRLIHEMSSEEKFEVANKAWQDYMEQKLRHLKGQSTFGPGGFTQRQRVNQNPDTRPLR